MTKSTTSRAATIGVSAGLMVLIGTGCAGNRQGTVASLKSPNADIVKEQTTLAVVTDIDRDTRLVTMKEADGDTSTVAVGDDVILGRMDTGDKVRVDYQESLAFQLLEPGQSIDEEEYTNAALPEGVLFGRKVATTVEIVAVADEGETTTVRSEDGAVHTMEIETKANRNKVAMLHPGDDVEVSCTEKLSIKLAR